jgi:hypothetical protein
MRHRRDILLEFFPQRLRHFAGDVVLDHQGIA